VKRFADDIVCYKVFEPNEISSIESSLQADIEIIQDYHEINGMSINPNKTKFMVFTSNDKLQVPEAIATLRGEKIERVKSHRYLGGTFDEKLTFSLHIKSICSKIRPIIGIMANLKHILPTHIMLNIYHSHVQSHLNFMSPLYALSPSSELDQLQVLQNRALKHVYKLPSDYSTLDLYTNVAKNILPVRGIAFINTLVYVHKIQKRRINSSIKFEVNEKGLRNDGDLIPARCEKKYLRKDVSYYGPVLYNNLSDEIKSSKSMYAFRRKAKEILMGEINKILNFSSQNIEDIKKLITKT
jgi:hypothetical protein